MNRLSLPRTHGWWRLAVSPLVAFGLLAVPNPAYAETYDQTPGLSSAIQAPGAQWALALEATLSPADAAMGMCVDSFFDWNVIDAAAGFKRHYDARVVRNCDVGTLRRDRWIDDPTGLTVTGPRKIGSCLVVGTDAQGRWGNRVDCEVILGAPVAPCGSGSAACFIRKNGVLLKTGWNFPQTAFS
jgi:hypothetical protein